MNSENPKSRPEIDMEGLRSRIKSALSAQRMTVQNLSDAAGIPKSTLDGFLNRGTTPAFDTVATVCAVLSIPVDSITGASVAVQSEAAVTGSQSQLDEVKSSHIRELNALNEMHRQEKESLLETHRVAMENHVAGPRSGKPCPGQTYCGDQPGPQRLAGHRHYVDRPSRADPVRLVHLGYFTPGRRADPVRPKKCDRPVGMWLTHPVSFSISKRPAACPDGFSQEWRRPLYHFYLPHFCALLRCGILLRFFTRCAP